MKDFIERFKRMNGLTVRRVSGVTQYLPQDYQKHIDGFYQMLREKYHKHRPQCIICLDETSVSYAPSAKTTLTDVGAKHVPIRNVQDKVTCTALLITAFKVGYT
eukprot:PhM_4_TR16823/c2_g1_i10/m.47851